MNTKVRKIGNGYGILLPKQVLDDLRLEEGSMLTILKKEDGVMLSHYDADFENQLAAFRLTEPAHRNSYRELAK